MGTLGDGLSQASAASRLSGVSAAVLDVLRLGAITNNSCNNELTLPRPGKFTKTVQISTQNGKSQQLDEHVRTHCMQGMDMTS